MRSGRGPAQVLLLAAVAAAAGSASACAAQPKAAPVVPEAARTEETVPRYRTWLDGGVQESDPTFRWTAGIAPLECRAAVWYLPAHRRLVVVAGDGTSSDELMVDTGTSVCMLSMSSPLARRLRFARKPSRTSIVGPPIHHGGREQVSTRITGVEMGVLPLLRLGSVEGRNVAFAATSESGSRANPASILGLDVLQGAALVRTDGAWRLETGPRPPWPGASSVRLEAAGLPVVRMTDGAGRAVHGLIDTGAPKNIAFASAGTGPWRLSADDGRVLLEIENAGAGGDASAEALRFGAVTIDLVVGLDALDRGTWRIDFERGVWEFAP